MRTANHTNTVRNENRLAHASKRAALMALAFCLAACATAGSTYRNPDSPFEATSTPESGPPVLKVDNGTDTTANIDCDGVSSQSMVVPPGKQREFILEPGTYACKLHGGGARPYFWSETYATDTVYSFTAIMRTY